MRTSDVQYYSSIDQNQLLRAKSSSRKYELNCLESSSVLLNLLLTYAQVQFDSSSKESALFDFLCGVRSKFSV